MPSAARIWKLLGVLGMDMVRHDRSEEALDRLVWGPASTSRRVIRYRFYLGLVVMDSLAIFLGFWVAALARHGEVFGANGWNLSLLIAPIYLGIALQSHAYGYQTLVNWLGGLGKALTAFVCALAVVLFVAFYTHDTLKFSRLVSGLSYFTVGGFLIAGRYAFSRIVRYVASDNLRDELIIVDRCAPITVRNARILNAQAHHLRPTLQDPAVLDCLGQLVQNADYVVVCCPPEDRTIWSLMLKGTGVQGYVTAPEFDSLGANRLESYHGHCVMQVGAGPLDIRSRILKRAMDLAFTVPAIVLLMPLLLVVALLIKLDSPGPVLFRQARMGRGNRLFSVLKFRSMHIDQCDAHGAQSASRGDQRITRVGRFIRASSLDELPQLFNVLRGEMSLVGPRPHALGSLAGQELFWNVDDRYWHRHSLKPGITGLAQIRGLRGATSCREDLARRLQADLEYMGNWSIWNDLAILVRTVSVMVHANAF